MVELPETREWEAQACANAVAKRYSKHQLNWTWEVETRDSFDSKYYRQTKLRNFNNAYVWIRDIE